MPGDREMHSESLGPRVQDIEEKAGCVLLMHAGRLAGRPVNGPEMHFAGPAPGMVPKAWPPDFAPSMAPKVS